MTTFFHVLRAIQVRRMLLLCRNPSQAQATTAHGAQYHGKGDSCSGGDPCPWRDIYTLLFEYCDCIVCNRGCWRELLDYLKTGSHIFDLLK